MRDNGGLLKRNSQKILYISLFVSISVWVAVFFVPTLTFVEDNVYLYLLFAISVVLFFILRLYNENKKIPIGRILSWVTIIICVLYVIYAIIAFRGKYSSALS